MKRNLTIFFQILIVLVGICSLAFILLEPLFEGSKTDKTLSQVYFNDPFLIWAQLASLPFFVALYQKFKIFRYVREGKIFSPESLKALRVIKYCGTILVGFALTALAYLVTVRPGDDIAGGVFMGMIMVAFSGVITAVASRWERRVKRGIK